MARHSTEVEQIFVKQTPDFTKYDLILFHGGADREMELASHDIQAKASSLIEAAESNTVFLSICAGTSFLGTIISLSRGRNSKA